MGTLFAIETANTVVLAIVSALSVPVPAQREGESELWIAELGLVGELWKAANGRAASFNRGVSAYPSLGDRVRVASRRGAGAGLLRRPPQYRPRRLPPAGPDDLGQRPRRRSARQAFCNRGNDGHRQVLHHRADPARHPAEAPGRPHGAARSAQRVCARLRRMGRGHQPAQHAAALLAPHLRGADRGADRQSAGAQGRSGDAAGPDSHGQGALRRRPRQHARGRPAPGHRYQVHGGHAGPLPHLGPDPGHRRPHGQAREQARPVALPQPEDAPGDDHRSIRVIPSCSGRSRSTTAWRRSSAASSACPSTASRSPSSSSRACRPRSSTSSCPCSAA